MTYQGTKSLYPRPPQSFKPRKPLALVNFLRKEPKPKRKPRTPIASIVRTNRALKSEEIYVTSGFLENFKKQRFTSPPNTQHKTFPPSPNVVKLRSGRLGGCHVGSPHCTALSQCPQHRADSIPTFAFALFCKVISSIIIKGINPPNTSIYILFSSTLLQKIIQDRPPRVRRILRSLEQCCTAGGTYRQYKKDGCCCL